MTLKDKLNTVKNLMLTKSPATNSGLAKVAIQCLNEHLCFVSSVVLEDCFMLRNRHLP